MSEASPTDRAGRSRALGLAIAGWALFIAIETATQVVFKFAGATLDDHLGVGHMVAQALATPVVLLGFALYFCGFLIWLTILKGLDLGRAFPMTAMIYVSTLASAVLLFHETLSPTRIAGVAVIALGVALLASDTGEPMPVAADEG